MKYITILGDGMSDYPIAELGEKTPLEAANKPNIDRLSLMSEIGLVKTIPKGMKPGSDTANLSVMGYDPLIYYTGRSPLEAISMGINLEADDIAIRANLVTLSEDSKYQDKEMLDYSAGEITTKEAKILIRYLNKHIKTEIIQLFSGISYRHCLIHKKSELGTLLTPPHDISGRRIDKYLPGGINGKLYLDIMEHSYELLKNHPINVERVINGKNPANSLWLWGEGVRPNLPPFTKLHGKNGAVISAVDLIKGIGIAAGMKVYNVKGATGNIHTNYIGKVNASIKAISEGADYVYLHIEAPDECSHQGDYLNKVRAIELIDEKVVKTIVSKLDKMGEDYSILILPDHPTPISTRTHSDEPVPYMLYRKNDRLIKNNLGYNEGNAQSSGIIIESGSKLMKRFFNK